MGVIDILLTFLVLHGPDGRVIHVNPDTIASMRSAVEGKDNEYLQGGVNCFINTTDGKFVAVLEKCDAIKLLIKGGESR
jgi:hypothetical protein